MAKSPLELAEKNVYRQIKAFEKGVFQPGLQDQLVDWGTGLQQVMQTFDQVIDPANPPQRGTLLGNAHHAITELGRNKRRLSSVLLGGQAEGNGAGESQTPAAPQGQAPVPGPATTPPQATAPQAPVAPQAPQPTGAAALGM